MLWLSKQHALAVETIRHRYILCISLFDKRTPEFVWRRTILSKTQLAVDCHREAIIDYYLNPFPEPPEVEVEYSWK